jgi:hypothetical protein
VLQSACAKPSDPPDVEFTLLAAPGTSARARVADELGNTIALAFVHRG